MLPSEFAAHSHLSDTSSLENTYGHPKGALCQYKTNFLNQLTDMHKYLTLHSLASDYIDGIWQDLLV
jgi:hypothetical protein